MIRATAEAAAGLALTCMAILLFLVATRARGRAVRRRIESERGRAETALAEYTAGGPTPVVPATGLARRTFCEALVDAVVELRGIERGRLVALFADSGLLAETAVALRDPRRASSRRAAADRLALVAHPDARAALRAGLSDRDVRVRGICARGLAALGDPEAVAALDGVALGDAADVLVVAASADPSLLDAAFASPRLRALAAEVAGSLRLLEHAGTLRTCLADGDPRLVVAAAAALGHIGDFEAVDALAALVRSPAVPEPARAVAARALGEIGDPAAAPALEEVLRRDGFAAASAAAAGLLQLGAEGRMALTRVGAGGGIASELARAVHAR